MSGSQKYRCHVCRKTYNPAPKKQGYPTSVRAEALKMYVDGLNFRRIARLLKVDPQSVANWVTAYHASLPSAPQAKPIAPEVAVDTLEADELFTFVGTKKASSTS